MGRAPGRAGPQERDELGPGPAGLGSEQAGEQSDDLLEPGAGALIGIECVGRAASLADEDDLGCRLQIGQFGVRIVDVPDDLGRWPVEPHQVEQRSQVALGLGRRPAAEGTARRHLGQLGRERGIVDRERVEEEQGPSPFLDVIGQVVDLFLSQRRWLCHQKHVQVRRDRRIGRDRAHVGSPDKGRRPRRERARSWLSRSSMWVACTRHHLSSTPAWSMSQRRPNSRPGDAVLDLFDLFGGVDVDRRPPLPRISTPIVRRG